MSSFFDNLYDEGKISESSINRIRNGEMQKVLSVHWDLRTLLYIGVLLTTSGLGILVYKNIDSIGHAAIIASLALISIAGYLYCWWKKVPFSWNRIKSPGSLFDYVLLLSCLCFVIFIGYWQYQYHIFGERYGLETFIPMIFLFFSAYYFDHLGILSLAITNLAAWAGVVVTPTRILKENDFNNTTLIYTGLCLGILFVLMGKYSLMKKIKPHFAFTYTNFGLHIGFISLLAAMFHFDNSYMLWLLPLLGAGYLSYREAMREHSFYYLLMLTLYSYIGISYVFVTLLIRDLLDSGFYFLCLYFIGSATAMILFLIRMNKKIKAA